jgi:hypothetical protein
MPTVPATGVHRAGTGTAQITQIYQGANQVNRTGDPGDILK